MTNILKVVVLCMAVVALAAPVASAQTAAQNGYDESTVLGDLNAKGQGGGGGNSPDTGSGNAPATVQSASASGGKGSGSSLPFTGIDVVLLLGAGVVLAGTGFAVRRAVRPPAAS